MLLGVEVLCGVWGPMVMLPKRRALPVLPDNTGCGEPRLSFKEKRFWLHLAKKPPKHNKTPQNITNP